MHIFKQQKAPTTQPGKEQPRKPAATQAQTRIRYEYGQINGIKGTPRNNRGAARRHRHYAEQFKEPLMNQQANNRGATQKQSKASKQQPANIRQINKEHSRSSQGTINHSITTAQEHSWNAPGGNLHKRQTRRTHAPMKDKSWTKPGTTRNQLPPAKAASALTATQRSADRPKTVGGGGGAERIGGTHQKAWRVSTSAAETQTGTSTGYSPGH